VLLDVPNVLLGDRRSFNVVQTKISSVAKENDTVKFLRIFIQAFHASFLHWLSWLYVGFQLSHQQIDLLARLYHSGFLADGHQILDGLCAPIFNLKSSLIKL